MKRKSPLLANRLHRLEERLVPAQFGTPWTDGVNVSMSFAPDGSDVDGAPSSLFQSMQSAGISEQVWQKEIIRAFTAWSNVTNLNVGIVRDGGQAFGMAGPTQGDDRFGDVRVFARPLSDNVLAVTTPPGYLGGTRVGDIVLNSTKSFSVGGAIGTYDLYSAMLQETGHALGVGNSINPLSPMYEQYLGVRTGLVSEDVSNIKDLYGSTRAGDALENGSNNSFGNAYQVQYTNGDDATALRSLIARADITTNTDVDYYRFKTPSVNNGLGVTVQITTGGFSSLAPRLYLYNNNQSVVGMVQTTNPLQGQLSIFMPSGSFPLNTQYYVRVDSGTTGNQYKIGSYQLRLIFNPSAGDVATRAGLQLLDDTHTNDSVNNATDMQTASGYAQNTHYRVLGNLRDGTDKDFYKFRSADYGSNQSQTMTVNVRAIDNAGNLAPLVSIYNKDKQLISKAAVLVNGDGTYTLQLPDAIDNEDYYVGVSAAPANGVVGTGQYHLDIDCRAEVVILDQIAAGTLTNANRTSFNTLVTHRDQVMHFLLSATGGTAGQSAIRMTIHDATGAVVFMLTAKTGETLSAVTALSQEQYTIRYRAYTQAANAVLPNLTYSLRGATIDNPIGPIMANPEGEYNVVQDTLAFYEGLALEEPLGDIVW